MSKLKHLIKVLKHLHFYTKFCSLCQASIISGSFHSSKLSHLGLAKASPLPGAFAKVPCQLLGQGSSPLNRVTMVQGPLHWGMSRVPQHLYLG